MAGIVECSYCGHKLIGINRKYYICGNSKRDARTQTGRIHRHIRRDKADERVLMELAKIFTPANMGKVIDLYLKNQPKDTSKKQISTLQRKLNNYLKTIGEGTAPKSVVSEINKLEVVIVELQEKAKSKAPSREMLLKCLYKLRNSLSKMEPAEIRVGLQKLPPIQVTPLGNGNFSISNTL